MNIGKYVFMLHIIKYIEGGSVSAPFTGSAYRVKYFKPIPKEINQNTSTLLS